MKELGPSLPVTVLHMHADTNVGGKTYGKTIHAGKIGATKLMWFYENGVIGISYNNDEWSFMPITSTHSWELVAPDNVSQLKKK